MTFAGCSGLVRYEIETTAALEDYGKVSIAFTVASKFVAEPDNSLEGGWELNEVPVNPPYVKDYDDGEPPTLRANWDTSNWRLVSAFVGEERVGGAMVACRTPGSDFLEERNDLAALWDIRVAPEWRGKGIGTGLFTRAVDNAKEHRMQGTQDRDTRCECRRLQVLCETGL